MSHKVFIVDDCESMLELTYSLLQEAGISNVKKFCDPRLLLEVTDKNLNCDTLILFVNLSSDYHTGGVTEGQTHAILSKKIASWLTLCKGGECLRSHSDGSLDQGRNRGR